MKNILLLALIIFGSIQLWEKAQNQNAPLYDEPYVAVYGRNSCGFTTSILSKLSSSGVNYHYFIIDDQSTANELHTRMEAAGISTRRYNLPVVDTNGSIRVRPEFQDVLTKYNKGL